MSTPTPAPQTGLFYSHSGKFSIPGLFAVIVLAGLSALVLGAVYAIAVYYIPIIYANVLLTVGLGFGLGWLVKTLCRLMHIRNNLMILQLGLGAGLVGLYAAWVACILVLSGWEVLIISPHHIWLTMVDVGEVGFWGLFSDDPISGVFLYLIWLTEAGIIIGMAGFTPWNALRCAPYCERCRAWVTSREYLPPIQPIEDPASTTKELEAGDFSLFGRIEPAREEDMQFAQMELIHCERCDQMNLLGIRNIAITVNKEGKTESAETSIVTNMYIDKDARQVISKIISEISPEPSTEEDAAEATENPAKDPDEDRPIAGQDKA